MAKAFIPTLFSDEEIYPLQSFFNEWTNWVPFRSSGSDLGLSEDDEAFYVDAPVPGLKSEDVKVSLHDHTLTISGERKEEKKSARVHRRVTSKYSFQVALPQTVDPAAPVDATLKDGILTVRLAKSRASKPIKVDVKSG